MKTVARNTPKTITAIVTLDDDGPFTLWAPGLADDLFLHDKHTDLAGMWDCRGKSELMTFPAFVTSHQTRDRYCVLRGTETKILPQWLRDMPFGKDNWPIRVRLTFGVERIR